MPQANELTNPSAWIWHSCRG